MPLFKFRVCWEDDDQIYRDIALKSGQTFDLFHTAIFKAFEFKEKKPASFFESNERWQEGREISSEVKANIKGAKALSMVRTPVSALTNQPEKRFLYRNGVEKVWQFQITLIALEKDIDETKTYPLIVKSEGISPINTVAYLSRKEGMATDTNDQFDLNQDDMEQQGFGEDEGF